MVGHNGGKQNILDSVTVLTQWLRYYNYANSGVY